MEEDNYKAISSLPNLLETVSPAELEQLEQLAELDPEVTRRLARALDRLQLARPYQALSIGSNQPTSSETLPSREVGPELSEEERAAHEEFVVKELSALLMLAGQLNHVYEVQPQAQPDLHFKDSLKAAILQQAQARKSQR